jgi:hypothetical protein
MNNEITQNEKLIYDLTMEILSHETRYKEKGIVFRVNSNTLQEDPHESKITLDLLYDNDIVDFIEFYAYEKGIFIKDLDALKKWLNEMLNKTYQNLTQYD